MTRSTFGGTTDDSVEAIKTIAGQRVSSPQANISVTFWSAKTGGTQYTDLLDENGNPATAIVSDENGQLPEFSGPDGVASMWADAEAGRVKINTNTGVADAGVAAFASDPNSQTRQALADAFVTPAITLSDLTEPYMIPHRGGGYSRPEHTLDGYRASIATGSQWLDTDCCVLADGGIAISHNTTVDATTNKTGNVSDYSTLEWQKLTIDASSWFGNGFPDSKPLVFDQILAEFGNRVILSVEPKSAATVQPMLAALARRKINKDTVWWTAFTRALLAPVVAAGYTCGWNTDDGTTDPAAIKADGMTWVGSVFAATSQARIAALQAVGLKCYVQVDTREQRDIALSWGANGIVTDAWDYANVDTPMFSTARYDLQATQAGMLSYNGTPTFASPDWCGYATAPPGNHRGWLVGQMCPYPNANGTYSVTSTVRMDSATDSTRLATLEVACLNDHRYTNVVGDVGNNGYIARIRKDGQLQLYRVTNNAGTLLGAVTSGITAIPDGGTATIKISVTPTTIKAERTDVPYSTATFNDSTYRGAYIHQGMQGVVGYWKTPIVA